MRREASVTTWTNRKCRTAPRSMTTSETCSDASGGERQSRSTSSSTASWNSMSSARHWEKASGAKAGVKLIPQLLRGDDPPRPRVRNGGSSLLGGDAEPRAHVADGAVQRVGPGGVGRYGAGAR